MKSTSEWQYLLVEMRWGWGVTLYLKLLMLSYIHSIRIKMDIVLLSLFTLWKFSWEIETSLTILQRYEENCFPSKNKENINCFLKTTIHINTEIKSKIRNGGQWVSKRLLKLQRVGNPLNYSENHLRITISATGNEVRLGSNTKPETLDAISYS